MCKSVQLHSLLSLSAFRLGEREIQVWSETELLTYIRQGRRKDFSVELPRDREVGWLAEEILQKVGAI